jgi:glycerol-3-phosphate dehydrogenase
MRETNLARLRTEKLREETFDVIVIGGGINGAGIARDLVLRDPGMRVALVEKNHFASGTSGKNSQLIHGGLRYLKYLEFHLVREALRERTTLLKMSDGLVQPLEFLLPCYSAADRWFYTAGLALYDLLSGKHAIGHPRKVDPTWYEPELACEGLTAGLLFHDCKVNSARLVLENILDAEVRGAVLANYVEARVSGKRIDAVDTLTGDRFTIRARKIVDATGAWSSKVFNAANLRLVRGSHLIFPRIQQGAEAIAFFDEHGRIVFLIPWGEHDDLTLVGTTDIDHHGSPDDVHISEEETRYLTSIVRHLFPSYRGEPVSSYSALRPLIAEKGHSATSTSREHSIWETAAGVLHIAGGKYTTYRAMSEELVDMLSPLPCRTAEVPLQVASPPPDVAARVRQAVEREYARRLPDLLYVSTYWGYERRLASDWIEPLAREMGALLGWDESVIAAEIARILTRS